MYSNTNTNNEKEFVENCKIKINDKIIPFNSYHKFKEKGI